MKKIPLTVGILTYNSEANLKRCLESVKNFTDIIIADGGSDDSTLSVAAQYGCRIVTQSSSRKPITDFAKERNILLSAAREKWFFYIDSDEIVSPELHDDLKRVAGLSADQYGAYRVRYVKTNSDASRIFRTYKEYYQVRLFRTDIGAQFVRPVHERVELPNVTVIGTLNGSWYVPLDEDDLSTSIFLRKAWRRTGIQAAEWTPAGVVDSFIRAFATPAVLIAKSSFKIIAVKLKWGKDAIPTKYEMLRILYSFLITLQSIRRIISFYSLRFTKKKYSK